MDCSQILRRLSQGCCCSYFQLNLIVSGTSEKLTVMLEGEAANLDKNLFLDGVKCGLESCAEIASRIKAGRPCFSES